MTSQLICYASEQRLEENIYMISTFVFIPDIFNNRGFFFFNQYGPFGPNCQILSSNQPNKKIFGKEATELSLSHISGELE